MNSENFLHYLKNPSHLYEITYQELKSLVLQYPYCHNLRYLLVTKSKIENHRDYSNDLKVAATYSLDRSLLHNQVVHNKYHQTSTDGSVVISEDYLELTELNKLEEKIEKESVISLGDEVVLESKEDLLNLDAINLAKTIEEVKPTASELSPVEELSNLSLIDQIMEEESADSEMSSDELSPLLEQKEPPNIVSYKELIEEEDEEEEEPEDEVEESADYDSDSGLDVLLSDEDDDLDEELDDDDYDSYDEEDSSSHHQTDPEEITIEPLTKLEVLASSIDEEDDYIDEEEDEEDNHSKEEDEDGLESASYVSTQEDSGLQPTPKQSFSSWFKQFQPAADSLNYDKPVEEKENKVEKTASKKKKHKTHKIAKKSVIENEEIASDTLAHLLASQGYYKKAIKMYEKLTERHPDKKDFYTAKIVELIDLEED